MKTYAYCRVSTADQNNEVQKEAIERKHPDAITVEEKASATSREGRPQLEFLLEFKVE